MALDLGQLKAFAKKHAPILAVGGAGTAYLVYRHVQNSNAASSAASTTAGQTTDTGTADVSPYGVSGDSGYVPGPEGPQGPQGVTGAAGVVSMADYDKLQQELNKVRSAQNSDTQYLQGIWKATHGGVGRGQKAPPRKKVQGANPPRPPKEHPDVVRH